MSEEMAWAAGFFDGEGSTFVQTRKKNIAYRAYRDKLSLKMRISQVRREPLDRFVLTVESPKRVRGPYVPTNPNGQPQYEWTTEGKEARRIIELLWPWLSEPKREQATKAILFLSEVPA